MNGGEAGRRSTGAGRRYLVSIGVSEYDSPQLPDLPDAGSDAERVGDLLADFGYERVLSELGTSPTVEQLASGVVRWTREARLGPDDVLVVYYAGHGFADGPRLRLLASDSEPDRAPTSLAADDFAAAIAVSGVGSTLAVLDVCAAEARDGEAAAWAVPLVHTRSQDSAFHLVTYNRDTAAAVSLVDAWTYALTHPFAGPRQPYLPVADVLQGIHRCLGDHGATRGPFYTGHRTEETEVFFPNPRYVPDLPRDTLDSVWVARLRHEYRDRFEARSRGVAHAAEQGDFFVGRTDALARLASWARAEPGAEVPPLVVTGAPGSGKSALLGRFLILTDPDSPARLNTEPQTLPPPGLAVIPISGRGANGLRSLAADLGAALGRPLGSPPEDVLAALRARTDPVVIVLDGLDEITPSAYDDGLIDFVRSLGRMRAVRLLVATRPAQLDALGPDFEVVDLDSPEYRDEDALRQVAHRLAQDPGRASAILGELERDLTHAVDHSFLTVHLLAARGLTADDVLPNADDLPSLFRDLLQRLGPNEARSERLLAPLAYAQGAGLPYGLWAPLVEALTGEVCTPDELRRFRDRADTLVVDSTRPDGTTVHRLFHVALAEFLRASTDEREQQRRMARGLVRLVPRTPDGRSDWAAADPYILEHLATHAAAGRILGEVVRDSAYLSHAMPEPLLRALADSGAIDPETVAPEDGEYRAPADEDVRADADAGMTRDEDLAADADFDDDDDHRLDRATATERAAVQVLSERTCVLVVATEWSSGRGGLSTFNRHLCVAMAAAGAQVFCIVLDADASEVTDAKEKGVTLLTHPGAPGAPDYGRLTRRPTLPYGTRPVLVIGHARVTGPAAAHLKEDFFPDARRLHFVHMAPDEIEWHKLGDGVDRARLAEERTEIERELGLTAHRVVAVGPALKRRFSNELWGAGVPEPLRLDPGFDSPTSTGPAGARGVPNAFVPCRPPPEGLDKVLFVGRTEDVRLKGVDLAARACGIVHELRARTSGEPIELFVRGAPLEKADEQQQLIRDWSGCPGLRVVVRPYSADPRKLESDMQRAGLVVMPSRSEAFGLVGQEAILRGVPVRVSDQSGLAQLLREELRSDADHLIVPVTGDFAYDASEWAERIEKCLTSRDEEFERMHAVRSRLAASVTWAAAARLVLAEAPPRDR
ncbi:glycosyltransferase [Streptomyces melanogenes]|uniref:D-inositol 3-phosphate glycosyltransferase n=1 Tax=Streptomyces melanogenes TaxID=67326 RepID=A0ABZ1XCA0_9ACTN|nr:glycosyltransferase [Streptomyces melanogenes]